MLITLLKKYAIFGIVFTIAKATVYFVPLLLADLFSKEDFGILEYALAGLGMIVNSLINLGVPGAYPYFIIRQEKDNLKPAFKLHSIVLLVPFVINQILFLGFNLDLNFYLAFNVSYIIANQVFYSTQFKSHEKSIQAVLIDSGIYIILLIYFLAFKLDLVKANIQAVNFFILGYSFIYVFYALKNYITSKSKLSFKKYKIILRFSVHLLISTFLIFLITTSGRILVEIFFDFESVGVYAFYFRLSAIVVMIYQIINIAFFKKIYTLAPSILDKYYFQFFALIFILSIAIFFISPYLVSPFSEYFNDTYQANKAVYFLLSAQMVMWIASALNSNIIDRENLAKRNNIKFLILVIISIVTIYLLKDTLTLSLLTYCHFTVIFLACLIQHYSLYKKSINFSKSTIVLTLIYVLSSSLYFSMF